MNLERLYQMQAELDRHILENEAKRGVNLNRNELLDCTILALLVEIGELANATRCFKHWSTKGPESKERLLDELADIWHFYLSIGNQLDYQFNIEDTNGVIGNLTETYIFNYNWVVRFKIRGCTLYDYQKIGIGLIMLGNQLGFTKEEVEQAYLKKHEENYRRQREGY